MSAPTEQGIRRLLRSFASRNRDTSPSPSTQIPSSTISVSSGPANSIKASNSTSTSLASLSQTLLERALAQLSNDDRQTLADHISITFTGADEHIDHALLVLEQYGQRYNDTRGTFTVAGRTFTMKEQVNKVVHWLNRFKAVGDIAVNADPVHAGLPWAAIRFLLEAAVANANHMASLLAGCEMALYMANRLKAYTEFLHQTPPAQTQTQTHDRARTNLETSLVALYACILHFQAQAIRIYQTSTARRVIQAFWKDSDIHQFEDECDKLGLRLDIEASNYDRARYQKGLQQILQEFQKYHRLQESIDRLRIKVDLDKLPYADGAEFDAHGGEHNRCHPGTRVDVLRQILEWAQQPDDRHIFWLTGLAGTGKSTISWTVAEQLASRAVPGSVDLGASFFFKRGGGDRGSAVRFFPTIVRQLADKMPSLAPLIAAVIDREPRICGKLLGEQFKKLLYQPLQNLSTTNDSSVLVIVVDALDECDEANDIRLILQLWSRLPEMTAVRLKLFITSRPEQPIRLGFKNMAGDVHRDMVLHDVPRPIIQHDISAFLRDSFQRIRQDYNDQGPVNPINENWPSDKTLQSIIEKTVPLFIAAVTICRFVEDPVRSPPKQLKAFLDSRFSSDISQLADTYLTVLNKLPITRRDRHDREQLQKEFQMIVGSIILLADPLSIVALASLLQLDAEDVESQLRHMHSVLQIPTNSHKPVQILHLSFAEFLLGGPTIAQHPFTIDGPSTHQMLLERCLKLLSSPTGLRENICCLSFPGYRRQSVGSISLRNCLPPQVQYACRYWVYHAQHSGCQIHDYHIVYRFLARHFLHWLEALSLIGRLSSTVSFINDLQSVLAAGSTKLSVLLEDAKRFILAYHHIIDLAPLQVYPSAQIFSPQSNEIRRLYGQIPPWISQRPIVPRVWNLELLRLEGHTGPVLSVAFSPDQRLVASASLDSTIRLWQVETGQEVQRLEGHANPVDSVAFCPPDGTLLASASCDNAIRLWQVQTGQEVQKLEGHTGAINSIAFSPDGTLLASASWNSTVRLWQVETGQEVQKLEGHTGAVNSIAFSPDGTLVASASHDTTIRLWQVETGQEVQRLEGHANPVDSVAFCPPDGTLLALASWDSTIRLWQVQTDQEVQRLEGHTGGVNSIAFSPDGTLVASASHDTTIRLWQVETGQEVQKLEGHTDPIISVALSPDGTLVVSASSDSTIRLWQVQTGKEVQKLVGHTIAVISVAFSPDGTLVAAASWDDIVRLWQVQTGQLMKQINECWIEKIMAFTDDGTAIVTDRGTILFDQYQGPKRTISPVTNRMSTVLGNITCNNEWVSYNNRDVLWLPQEYRTDELVVRGDTIALGRANGTVSIIRLDRAALERDYDAFRDAPDDGDIQEYQE